MSLDGNNKHIKLPNNSPETNRNPFNGLFSRTTWVSRHQKAKSFWISLKQEMMDGSGISWTIIISSAPRSRQITTSSLSFYKSDAFPEA